MPAGVAELVYAHGLGPCGAIRESSSLSACTSEFLILIFNKGEVKMKEEIGLEVVTVKQKKYAPIIKNGLPATAEAAFYCLGMGDLRPALRYAAGLSDLGLKTDLIQKVCQAAIRTGRLEMASKAASIIGLKLTEADLWQIFRASLAAADWKNCAQVLDLFDSRSKKQALRLSFLAFEAGLAAEKWKSCGEILGIFPPESWQRTFYYARLIGVLRARIKKGELR